MRAKTLCLLILGLALTAPVFIQEAAADPLTLSESLTEADKLWLTRDYSGRNDQAIEMLEAQLATSPD
ncbi:MAG: hypothetical protein GY773_04370, partial [Actinomycetia bacterium]|nr:hypothetical protein [Actinomycetes bacterium]